jgi:putative FmdB family regulatory protein
MPLYEYQCDACGHRFERIQTYSDPLVEACPSCGGAVSKLVSSPAFHFKGSGWYITDYARKGEAKTEGRTEAGTDGKAEGGASSESKPGAEKAESSKASADSGSPSSDSKPAAGGAAKA